MAKFMHIWGEVNFWSLIFGVGMLIPSFDGTFMQPMWLAFASIGVTALSYAIRARLQSILNRRSRKVRVVPAFD